MKNPFARFLPKPRYIASFYMKSGSVIKINCGDIKIKTDGEKLISYTMTDLRPAGAAMYIRITDVDAITYVKV